MRSHRIRRASGASILILATLWGCAGAGPPALSEGDLERAREQGNLEALYEQLSAELTTARDGSRAAQTLRANRDAVGARLASDREQLLRAALEPRKTASGRLPEDALAQALEGVAALERWDPARARALREALSAERAETGGAIDAARAQLAQLDSEDAPARLRILETLAALSGPDSPAATEYAEARRATLETLSERAAHAIENEAYADAQSLLRLVREIDPSDERAGRELIEVDAKAFEQGFWLALEQGAPERAFERLETLAASEAFPEIRTRLESSANLMASYFAELGATATGRGELSSAYRWFLRARETRRLLGQRAPGPVPQERAFVERMHAEYATAREAERPGLAWGYLRIIEQLQPEFPSLRRLLREGREAVERRAIKRLSASPFADSSSGPEFGEAVGTKVIQYLFESIPHDIRIIEREQLSDILREKQMRSDGAAQAKLASADYLVQGNILEAKVDTTESRGRKILRVVTGRERVPNPEHQRWAGLSGGERKKTAEPPATVEVEKQEDVTLNVTVHRKVGVFSVSYRVIDANNAKVVFADSLRLKEKHEDDSSEGIQLGEFEREFKLASLPSDLEILAELADRVSEQIGQRLARVLADPEVEFEAHAKRYEEEGNFSLAGQQYAFALAVAESKERATAALHRQMTLALVASAESRAAAAPAP